MQQKLKASRDAAEKQRLTAEIIANRELVGAKRGGAGLDGRPDPAAVEARTAELAAEMSKVYASDPRGHGGKMLDNYNQAAQPERAAQAKAPVSYLDYINDKLNLEQPTDLDVAKLVTATALYIREPDGARAAANQQEIEKTAAAMMKQPAFQELMKDPATLQNAKMGLGLPLVEQLQAKQAKVEPQQPQAQPDAPKKQGLKEAQTAPTV